MYLGSPNVPGGDFSTLLELPAPSMSGPRILDSKPAPTIDENWRPPRPYLSDRAVNAAAR